MDQSALRSLGLALACVFSFVTSAFAGTIVDTGEPSGPAGYSIFNSGSENFNAVAGRFTLTQKTQVTGIFGFFGTATIGQDEVLFSLHNDSSGVGSSIASENVVVGTFNLGPQLVAPGEPFLNSSSVGDWYGAFLFGSGPVLDAGNYWISFSVDGNNPYGCVCFMPANTAPTIPFGAYRNQFTVGNWSQRELYFGLRVYGNPFNSAVPEPASWTLMIAGFGLIGEVMRRHKRIAFS